MKSNRRLRHIVLRLGAFTIRHLRLLVSLLLLLVYSLAVLWCCGALYYSNLPTPGWRLAGAIAFFIIAVAAWRLPKRFRYYAAPALLLAVIVYWCLIPASNDRDWQPSVSRNPAAEFSPTHPGLVTIRNIRDFRYRTEEDFTVRYLDADYDLSTVQSLDFIVVHWDGHQAIAHTMLSFGFADGRRLAFSAETRLEKQETYSTFKGIYKQFEILYIIGTEEDLFGLRTNYRHEQLYLYPTSSPPETARIILTDLLERVNALRDHPQFYNSLTTNCTTSLLPSLLKVFPNVKFDLRILLNGFSDRYAMEYGWLVNPDREPFDLYKARHLVNRQVDFLPEIPDDYSERIRAAK